ncbi:MAG: cytochrome c oxidase, subunit [Verrucomicrobia bacterium]|nr:cytochrome c oxidase, subunit [Verrucomicrobiota bacterium]
MRLNSLLSTTARWARAALALAGTVLLTGCDLNFWRMDGHQSTIAVDGPVARSQRDLFYVTCWVTLVIFIIVGSVLAYATIKFRARSSADEHAEPPEQGHGNPMIELGLIGASVLALVIIAIPTLSAIWYTHDVPEADKSNAYDVTATGYQWWFRFDYPNEQIPGSGTLNTSNELVIPAGRPVRIQLRSVDVIHSFWIPKLAGKVDMIPNRGNFLWLKADAPGYYWGQCAEYCGDSHAVMRFRVIALGPKEFNDWLNQQMAPARNVTVAGAAAAKPQFASYRKDFKQNERGWSDRFELNPLDSWRAHQEVDAKGEDAALIQQGRQIFNAKSCVNCHTVRGNDGSGINGPNLTHVGARTTIAGGLLENTPEQVARWLRHPDQVKPGNKMYYGVNKMAGYLKLGDDGFPVRDQNDNYVPNITLTEDDITALVAYISSLK